MPNEFSDLKKVQRGYYSLVNTNGVPIPKPRPMVEMGVSGVTTIGGRKGRPVDYEKSPEWMGKRKYKTAQDIAINISIVAAGIHYFLNLIAHASWAVKPSDENDEESVLLAEFVENVMHDMTIPWQRIVRKSGLYRFHGFSLQEWTAKRRADGLIGLESIEPRPQFTIEDWIIDENGTIEGVVQESPQTSQQFILPRGKLIYLVEDTFTDSPEGIGVFRQLGEPYNRLKTYLALETRGFERDLRGTPVGRVPISEIKSLVKAGQITEADGNALINTMKSFVEAQVKQSNTGIVLDSSTYVSQASDGDKFTNVPKWGIELMSGSGAGLQELAQAIDRLQREIARLIGCEQLMMGDKAGSRALSTDKSRNLYLIANGVNSYIASTYRNDMLNPLWLLNGFPMDKKPNLVVEDVAFKDVEQIAAVLRDIAVAGSPLAPTDPVVNDLRNIMGVSPQDMEAAIKAVADANASNNSGGF